jgi:hypothetical protein
MPPDNDSAIQRPENANCAQSPSSNASHARSPIQLPGQRECPPALKSVEACPVKTTRRKLALVAWAAQVLSTVAALAACAAEIHTILFTGPALAVSGFALALVTRPLRSWSVLGFSLSGPGVVALGATLIAVFRWGPDDAEVPILAILFIYTLLSVPVALTLFPEILRWSVSATSQNAFWQYSLKSLLVLTTALCVTVPIIRALLIHIGAADSFIFSTFVMVTLALIGLSVWMFQAGRRNQ